MLIMRHKAIHRLERHPVEWFGEYQVAEIMYDTIYAQTHTAILAIFYGYKNGAINARKKSVHRHIPDEEWCLPLGEELGLL